MKWINYLLITFLITACVPVQPTAVNANGQISLQILFPQAFKTALIKPETREIRAVVYGEGLAINNPLRSRAITPQSPRITLRVPLGKQIVLVAAYDANKQILTAGKQAVNVRGRTTATVTLTEGFKRQLTSQELRLLQTFDTAPSPSPTPARPTPESSPISPEIIIQPEATEDSRPTLTLDNAEENPARLPFQDILNQIDPPQALNKLRIFPPENTISELDVKATGNSLTLSWKDNPSDGIIGYILYLNNRRIPARGRAKKQANDTFSFTFDNLESARAYQLGVASIDRVRGQSRIRKLETRTAQLSFVQPAQGISTTSDNPVALSLELKGLKGYSASTIELLQNEKNLTQSGATINLNPEDKLVESARFNFNWNPANLPDGIYQLKVVAKDKQKNILIASQTMPITLRSSSGTTIDALSPIIHSVAPFNEYNDFAHTVTLNGENFLHVNSVKLGVTPLTNVQINISGTQLTATVPAFSPQGTFSVTITDSATNSIVNSSPDVILKKRHFVNLNATGANNGNTWNDAFTSLQTALTTGAQGDEFWVAKGTYKPTQDLDRTQTFTLLRSSPIYGGFNGTELDLALRDTVNNLTTLSGDLSNNDTGTNNGAGVFTDNSHHVVTGANSAILDGLTISGGNTTGAAFDSGGGVYNPFPANTIVKNSIITNNYSAFQGGGMFNGASIVTVSDTTFTNNTAALRGGAVHNQNSSDGSFTNCTFTNNFAGNNGGGLNNFSASPSISNSVFDGNQVTIGGGFRGGAAMSLSGGGTANITNTTIINNISANQGGGVRVQISTPVFNNVTIENNQANADGGGMYFTGAASTINLDGVLLRGNQTTAGKGGGIFNNNVVPTKMDNLIFSGNIAQAGDGGGLYNFKGGTYTIKNAIFVDNQAQGGGSNGGAINNDNDNGGNPNINILFQNVTIANNSAGNDGGGMFNKFRYTGIFQNCIVYGNMATGQGRQFYMNNALSHLDLDRTTLEYSGVALNTCTGGTCAPHLDGAGGLVTDRTANNNTNPQFVNILNAAGPDGEFKTSDDGLLLLPASSVLNTGDSTTATPTDIRGIPRPTPVGADRGAYEQ